MLGVYLLQVSDWWEQYVYLRGRAPIMINSNYYGIVRLCDVHVGSGSVRSFKSVNQSMFYFMSVHTEVILDIHTHTKNTHKKILY